MASPELAITKATLSATLFRADPTSLNRAAVDDFFSLLDQAIIQCSRQNVQKCRAWIVDNIVPSTARCTALGKFWAVLSKNLAEEADGKRPSARRRRLHLLYIANDVLYHQVVRQGSRKVGEAWAGVLPAMMGHAAAFDNFPKHKAKLSGLIDLWEDKAYFTPDLIAQLRTALSNGSAEMTAVNLELSETSLKLAKDAPYILPSFHGDASIPWYDLPAGTWLPHITPNSSRPMIPDQIRPIQLAAGPAEKRVVDAVKTLLKDADYIYSKESEPSDDVHMGYSEMGERIVLDEITGEVIGGDSYYGWSRQFCERMRERRKKQYTERSRAAADNEIGPMTIAAVAVLAAAAAEVPAEATAEAGVPAALVIGIATVVTAVAAAVEVRPGDTPAASNLTRSSVTTWAPGTAPLPPYGVPQDGSWAPPFPPPPELMAQLMGMNQLPTGSVPPPPPPPPQPPQHNNQYGRGNGNGGYRGRGRGGYGRGGYRGQY
ncbi:hypothetical protein J3F83DRAFT_758833 [Trichoderma novae-zelandiae]